MTRPTLLGQLTRAHVVVVAATCALLVIASIAGGVVVLRRHQDRIIEAVALEVANGAEVEAAEARLTTAQGADEYFSETRLAGFRFELLSKDGRLVASDGQLPGWSAESYEMATDAKAGTPRLRPGAARMGRFRGCARWCGPDHVLRVVTTDVLGRTEIRWFAGILVIALPVAAAIGAALGQSAFRRRLLPLGRLEAAAAASSAAPGVTLHVEASAREIATLQDAFNGLLARIGEALARERRFSQEASHELRTPLSVLRARIERLAADPSLAVPQREELAAATHDVEALDRLVDALLLLARSESSPLPTTPVNLCDVAREVAERRAATDGAGSVPPVVEAPDEILIRGSEELLACAIGNLVDNARKFGGRRARVRIRVAGNGDRATVSVADDGPGIAAAERDRIFERFYRAPASRTSVEGVGLGLAVARTIVMRHHGVIEAGESDLGGAELTLAFPRLIA